RRAMVETCLMQHSDTDRPAAGEPSLRPETLAVAAGRPPREPDQPLNQPIVPASTYVGGSGQDWIGYGRYGNPGWSALEQAVGALEGGSALAFASGMAAAAAVFDALEPEAVMVIPRHCY